MKKFFTFILGAMLVLPFNSKPQTQNQALIFSIDVSKSMRQPQGFYNTLKEQIKTFIKNDVQVNDLVTIYSFGDDVRIVSDAINFKVTGTQDVEKLIQFVDKLKPTDDNTFLTKAIDILAGQMESLQKQYKDMPIKTFLFTDGKNSPPSGASSLSLADILNKHKATFQNPYTYTYIITLGTKLDKELQDVVNDPTSGIYETSEDKDLTKRSVSIIPSDQRIRVSSSNLENIKAKFQFLSIKNINEGLIKFNRIAGSIGNAVQGEVSFNLNSSGKSFSISLKIASDVKAGKHELKFAVVPVNDNFEVIPKEIKIELELLETSIELTTDTLFVESSIEGGIVQIKIEGNNKASKDIQVVPLLNPTDEYLFYEGEPITLTKGEFQKDFELKVNPIAVGEYSYTLLLRPVAQEVRIEKLIPVTLIITEPFNWGLIILIIILILIALLISALIYLYFYSVKREFSKYTISGMGIMNENINDFKKFWATKIIIGKDIFSDSIGNRVLTIKADLKTPFDKKLKLEWHDKDKTYPADVINFESLQSMKVQYDKKYVFEIEKI